MIDQNLQFPDIMIDIETTGTDVGINAILQIAAVKFNLETGAIDHNMFDRCLTMPTRRCWDENTREWWGKKPPEILQGIWGRGEDPATVLIAFADWAGPNARFWGKPTHFDFAFLQNYYAQFDMRMPFHYRYAEDMNSWIRGRYWPKPKPDFEQELPFEGPKHNAIFDALHQIKVLLAVKEDTKNQVLLA